MQSQIKGKMCILTKESSTTGSVNVMYWLRLHKHDNDVTENNVNNHKASLDNNNDNAYNSDALTQTPYTYINIMMTENNVNNHKSKRKSW